MKYLMIIVWALCSMNFSALAEDDDAIVPSHTAYEFGQSPYLALSSGAELYLGRISAKHVDEKTTTINVESGQVDIAVEEVLRGRKLKTLDLSYQCQVGRGGRRPVRTPWPPIDDLMKKNAVLLIVVAPVRAENEKSPTWAASNVYAIEGKEDPNVLTYGQFLTAFSQKGDELERTLMGFAQSKESLRRRFAADFAYKQLEEDAALSIIQAQVETAASQNGFSNDLSDGFSLLFHLAYDTDRKGKLSEKVQLIFARQAASENTDVSGYAMQSLADSVSRGMKSAKELLTPADRERLMKAASIASEDPTNISTRQSAQIVLAWLEKSKG